VETRLVQVEGDALRCKLHGSVALCSKAELRRRKTTAKSSGLVQIALRGKEETVSGERLRQQTCCDLRLFLENDISQRGTIDCRTDCRPERRVDQSARVWNLQ